MKKKHNSEFLFEIKQISSSPAYIIYFMNAQRQSAVEKSKKQANLSEGIFL